MKGLGELIFGMGYVQEECNKLGKPLQEHLQALMVHGFCHLLGYDHITSAQVLIVKILCVTQLLLAPENEKGRVVVDESVKNSSTHTN